MGVMCRGSRFVGMTGKREKFGIAEFNRAIRSFLYTARNFCN